MGMHNNPRISTDRDKIIFVYSPKYPIDEMPKGKVIHKGLETIELATDNINSATASLANYNQGTWCNIDEIAPNSLNRYQLSCNDINITDGITFCGFFKVLSFPNIYTGSNAPERFPEVIRQKSSLNIVDIGMHNFDQMGCIGVRRDENTSNTFAIGWRYINNKNLSLSIISDYVYNINVWYFYSCHIKKVSTLSYKMKMCINGEVISTYYNGDLKFNLIRASYNKAQENSRKFHTRPKLNPIFPIKVGFLNYNDSVVIGNINTEHTITLYKALTSSNSINTLYIEYNVMKTFCHYMGIHENIQNGLSIICNNYDFNVKNVYENFKTLYL